MPYTTVNDYRIHFLDMKHLGDSIDDGKLPIVMVHGLGGSQNYYAPIIPQLKGHRCVAPSTYGAAQSRSHGEKLTVEELAEDVTALMSRLGIQKAIIVGHSMGGLIACHIAATRPEKVAGPVCLGPVHPESLKREVFTSRVEIVLQDGMEPLADIIPATATNANSTPLQKAIIREIILGQDPKSYISHCDVLLNIKEMDLASIRSPVLILAGEKDETASLEGCEHIHRKLGSQRKELKVMKGVGHWHCIEASNEVAAEIRTFASNIVLSEQ